MSNVHTLPRVGDKSVGASLRTQMDREDRAEAREDILDRVQKELFVAMSMALAGDKTMLDSTRPHQHAGCLPIETSVHRVEAVNEAMNSMKVLDAFFDLLKHCESTHASALRKLICEDYATSNAENVALTRGLIEG